MNKSAASAKQYYSDPYLHEGKSLDDYYSEKENIAGMWGGKGIEKLGLSGDIKKEDFSALCDNINPLTGEQLTARQNDGRRVGYDFTFDAGKSISLAYAFGTDEQKHEIMSAFRDSVKETMSELEKSMQARVRVAGQDYNRDTSNIIYGEFVHFTTRPVDGIPDPQLHAHCFTFNATYDNEEDKWKAGNFGEIKENAPYYEAMFHSTLADRLQVLGYEIQRNKNGFELKGIDRETIDKFSKRTKQIKDFAEKEGVTNANRKAAIGSITRESKRADLNPENIWNNWENRLTDEEKEKLKNLQGKLIELKDNKQIAIDAVQYSLDHHLYRKSVSDEKEILTTAIKTAIGEASYKEVRQALYANTNIIWVGKELTTKQALDEENNLIKTAQEFRGKFQPINKDHQFKNEKLTDEQKRAVFEALSTKDGITVIGGKAGTGKTTLMKEVQAGIQESGKEIFAFAPTNEASKGVQRSEGFYNAQTVASLLDSKALQEKVKNGIIWIDEAGMLSNVDMNGIMSIAKKQNAKIILTGDTKQHTSVQRGDALRILQSYAGYSPVMITKIQRQTRKEYKKAAEAISKGDMDKGLNILNDMGALHEIDNHQERFEAVATDYVKSKNALVVAPSHKEGNEITSEIRKLLKLKDEREHLTYQPVNYTNAEKSKIENYNHGQYIIFHMGKNPGSVHEIDKTDGNTIYFKSGETTTLDKARNFNVFEGRKKSVGIGEKIRLNGKAKSIEGVHLFNGSTFQVKEYDHEGRMVLDNGATLPKGFGRFTYGYVSTSVSSQGKTVDKVIIAQSQMSGLAATGKQGYVSMTRGRKEIAWYTDDKQDLLQAVSRTGDRKSAMELVHKVTEIKRRKQAKDRKMQNEIKKPKDKEPQIKR